MLTVRFGSVGDGEDPEEWEADVRFDSCFADSRLRLASNVLQLFTQLLLTSASLWLTFASPLTHFYLTFNSR